ADGVGPVAAGQGIGPGAAVDRQLHLAGGEVGGDEHVITAQHVHHQGVFRVRAEDVHKGNRTHGGVDAIAEGPALADIVSVGAVDDDRVGLAIAGARKTEVEVERVQAGRGLVVEGDGVGAAVGEEVDLLDAAQVHRDAADVAGESGA